MNLRSHFGRSPPVTAVKTRLATKSIRAMARGCRCLGLTLALSSLLSCRGGDDDDAPVIEGQDSGTARSPGMDASSSAQEAGTKLPRGGDASRALADASDAHTPGDQERERDAATSADAPSDGGGGAAGGSGGEPDASGSGGSGGTGGEPGTGGSGGAAVDAGPLIACLDNGLCPGDQDYCQKPTGQCAEFGICMPIPSVCSPEVDRVCGCDGVTYGNACVAAANGVSIEGLGACRPAACGLVAQSSCCFDDADCPSDERCVDRPTCAANGEGVCKPRDITSGMCWEDADCGPKGFCASPQICGCGISCVAPDQPGNCL